MSACTHGQPLWHHLAVGDICPVCRTTIVAVAVAAATGHRGEVAPEATPQASLEVPLPATIAAGVAPCRKDGDGPPPVPPAPAATIATPAPTPATPCPALRLPVATPSANAPHGAGVALNAQGSGGALRTPPRGDLVPVAAGATIAARAGVASPTPAATPSLLVTLDLWTQIEPATHSARLTDPDTAHEAAAAVTDVARRNVYRAVLEALVEHGPSTDHDLARYVAGKLGHPIGQTSVGVRRGELRNARTGGRFGSQGSHPHGSESHPVGTHACRHRRSRSSSSMTTNTIRADLGAVRDAATVVPAMTLAEYRARTANATRPITDPPIGARRRPGSSPTWGDFA